MVEYVAVNHRDEGSIPSQAVFSGSLMVKCPAHNGHVIGSIPIRSKEYPSSIIGSAYVCKTLGGGSIPLSGLRLRFPVV